MTVISIVFLCVSCVILVSWKWVVSSGITASVVSRHRISISYHERDGPPSTTPKNRQDPRCGQSTAIPGAEGMEWVCDAFIRPGGEKEGWLHKKGVSVKPATPPLGTGMHVYSGGKKARVELAKCDVGTSCAACAAEGGGGEELLRIDCFKETAESPEQKGAQQNPRIGVVSPGIFTENDALRTPPASPGAPLPASPVQMLGATPLSSSREMIFSVHNAKTNRSAMLDMDHLHSGKDQYWCRGIKLKGAELQEKTGFTVVKNFYHNFDYIHHVSLYVCDGSEILPTMTNEENMDEEDPFRCEGKPMWPGCERMIITWPQGTHDGYAVVLPKVDGKQLFIPFLTKRVFIQMHYKWNWGRHGEGVLGSMSMQNKNANPPGRSGGPTGRSAAMTTSKTKEKFVRDHSSVTGTIVSESGARKLGYALKSVQLFEFGARRPQMLTVPPGEQNFKASSVCPSECFRKVLGAGHMELVAATLHAHIAATSTYAELIHPPTRTSHLIKPEPDYLHQYVGMPRDGVYAVFDPPINITGEHTVKTTCVYNTSERSQPTVLGPHLKDEMCFLYALVAPVIPGFSSCWHTTSEPAGHLHDDGGQHDPSSRDGGTHSTLFLTARKNTTILEPPSCRDRKNCRCRGECPGRPFFELPKGASKWPRNGIGWQGVQTGFENEDYLRSETGMRVLPDSAFPSGGEECEL